MIYDIEVHASTKAIRLGSTVEMHSIDPLVTPLTT